MAGRATLTTLPSRKTTNEPRIDVVSMRRLRVEGDRCSILAAAVGLTEAERAETHEEGGGGRLSDRQAGRHRGLAGRLPGRDARDHLCDRRRAGGDHASAYA